LKRRITSSGLGAQTLAAGGVARRKKRRVFEKNAKTFVSRRVRCSRRQRLTGKGFLGFLKN
jgi:hypothetical protein